LGLPRAGPTPGSRMEVPFRFEPEEILGLLRATPGSRMEVPSRFLEPGEVWVCPIGGIRLLGCFRYCSSPTGTCIVEMRGFHVHLLRFLLLLLRFLMLQPRHFPPGLSRMPDSLHHRCHAGGCLCPTKITSPCLHSFGTSTRCRFLKKLSYLIPGVILKPGVMLTQLGPLYTDPQRCVCLKMTDRGIDS
jgi:hypothetical protein